jgi:hypothetical protein
VSKSSKEWGIELERANFTQVLLASACPNLPAATSGHEKERKA